jgi:hypothetical protein
MTSSTYSCMCTVYVNTRTLGRSPLDEGLANRRDLYLTTYNILKSQKSVLSAEFEPAIPEINRPQTHTLDHWDRRSTICRLQKFISSVLISFLEGLQTFKRLHLYFQLPPSKRKLKITSHGRRVVVLHPTKKCPQRNL